MNGKAHAVQRLITDLPDFLPQTLKSRCNMHKIIFNSSASFGIVLLVKDMNDDVKHVRFLTCMLYGMNVFFLGVTYSSGLFT